MNADVLPWAALHSTAGLSSSSNLAKLPLQPSTRTPAQRHQSGKICQQFICAHLHTSTRARAAAGAECWLYSKWGNLEIIIIIMIRLNTSSRHETRSLGRSRATNCIRIYSLFIMGGRTHGIMGSPVPDNLLSCRPRNDGPYDGPITPSTLHCWSGLSLVSNAP